MKKHDHNKIEYLYLIPMSYLSAFFVPSTLTTQNYTEK